MSRNRRRLFGLILLVNGVAWFLAGLGMLAWNASFVASAEATHGEVIAMTKSGKSNSNSGVSYQPRISFADRSGEIVEFEPSFRSNPPPYEIGEQVTVLYLADDPSRAMVDSFFMKWGLPLIFVALGVFALPVGLYLRL